MNTRAWIVLLFFLGWAVGSWYWYTHKIKGYRYAPSVVESLPPANSVQEKSVATEETPNDAPLTFKRGSADAYTTDEWPAAVDELLTTSGKYQQLTISGAYSLEETNNSAHANLGVARALAVKALLADKYDTALVSITSHIVEEAAVEGEQFEGVKFNWLTNTPHVKQLKSGALIYFPYKSDQKIDDPAITAYLDEMVAVLSENDQRIEIIGHTDDKGSAPYNLKLGQERSKAIKALLVAKGIDASRINSTSKGESDPLVPNTTEENKAKNRRTEIKIR